MARRKKNTIDLKSLKIYSLLLEELEKYPNYADKDFTSLNLTVYDSFEANIKDVDKAILRLKRYIAANKKFIDTVEDEQLINRVELSKMLGISRQTLSQWIKKGFITPQKSKYLRNVETFSTDAVLRELQAYQCTHSEK